MSTPEFTPIGGRNFLSPAKQDWFRTGVREHLSRCAAIANVLTRTARPSNPSQNMWDSIYINLKLHDGEPEVIVKALEAQWPNFFDLMPCRGPVTLDKKKEIVGEWCKSHIRLGLSAYGKPNLRKDKSDGPMDDLGGIS
jgi:hypothetical protein